MLNLASCPLIHGYSANSLLSVVIASTLLLLTTWLSPWESINQPANFAHLLILSFSVFPLYTHTHLVKGYFLLLHRLSGTLSLMKSVYDKIGNKTLKEKKFGCVVLWPHGQVGEGTGLRLWYLWLTLMELLWCDCQVDPGTHPQAERPHDPNPQGPAHPTHLPLRVPLACRPARNPYDQRLQGKQPPLALRTHFFLGWSVVVRTQRGSFQGSLQGSCVLTGWSGFGEGRGTLLIERWWSDVHMLHMWVGLFQAAAGFQDSDIFQEAIEMVLRCILSVNSHLSGFKL